MHQGRPGLRQLLRRGARWTSAGSACSGAWPAAAPHHDDLARPGAVEHQSRGILRAQHGRRQRVFCASLADVFDNEVDLAWRVDLFQLIADTPNLDWMILTKRIGNAARMINEASVNRVCKGAGEPTWPWRTSGWRHGGEP